MRAKYYFLFLLITSPLLLGLFIDAGETVILVPDQPVETIVRGNGNTLSITTSARIDLNITPIVHGELGESIQTTVFPGETYEYTFATPQHLEVDIVSSSVAEVKIMVSGIPSQFFVYVGLLLVLNLLMFSDEILHTLKLKD
ncbi:MAG: hypothetical protein ACXAE3_06225 [Candidatus Kariarchaeaceae archaeon]|jgi:hypothetical protein